MNLLYVVAKAEYFLSHRLDLAKSAQLAGFKVSVATTLFSKSDIRQLGKINKLLIRFKRGGIGPFTELRAIIDLFKVFKKVRPNLVHNIALKPSLYGAAIARFYKVPSVNAINGFGYIFTSRQLKAQVLKPFVKFTLKLILNSKNVSVIVQNQQDYQNCKELFPKCNLFLVLGSGVNVKIFSPVVCKRVFTFTLVARMLWSKGIKEFVEAARKFIKNNPEKKVRFLLVGSSDPENPESISEEILKKWQQEGVVEWKEHTSNIQEIYAQSHVAVLPSYREGLPKSLLEAMACGLPIITTDAIGCNDLVHDGNGIKVPVKNVQALERAFEKCVINPKICEIMGKKAREEAEKIYSVDIINRQVLDIYNKILKKN